MHDKPDPSVVRFPDVDLSVPKPERSDAKPRLPPRSYSKDGIAMFGYLETELGPVGTRSIEVADRPAWPVRPLDLTCMEATAPRPDVLKQIQGILPTFSPEENSLAWCSVADLVRSVGRSAEEVRLMGYDELARLLDVHGQRLRLERCDLDAIVGDLVAAITGELRDRQRPPKQGKTGGLKVDLRLKELCRIAPTFCIDAELEEISQILNCGVSSFYGGEFFENHLRRAREKAREAQPEEVFDSEQTMANRAKRAQKAAMGRIDDRIDAEG